MSIIKSDQALRTSHRHMLRRIKNKQNLRSLVVVPLVLWGCNFTFHLCISWIQNPIIWITLISLTLPILAYFLVTKIYSRLSVKLDEMLPPEIPGIIGFLYSQPVYTVFFMVLMNLYNPEKILSLNEATKIILIFTPMVPVSTIMVSMYDGTLVAVPLTCMVMILAGYRYRKNSCCKVDTLDDR